MTKRLRGKKIAVTGAAQGIGLAIVKAFLSEGASVLAIDLDENLLAQSIESLGGESESLAFATGDITDSELMKTILAGDYPKIGALNGLVNNAGVNVFSNPLNATDEDWYRALDINVKGAWNCSQALLPQFVEAQGGVILNIASTHAFTIIPETFPYPVAKHALLGLTKSLGIEFAPNGIRVNAIAPGYIETQKVVDYWNSFEDPIAAKAQTLKLHPSGVIGTPEEIANAAIFMVSDECRFMNATCLTIDGGMSILHHVDPNLLA